MLNRLKCFLFGHRMVDKTIMKREFINGVMPVCDRCRYGHKQLAEFRSLAIEFGETPGDD